MSPNLICIVEEQSCLAVAVPDTLGHLPDQHQHQEALLLRPGEHEGEVPGARHLDTLHLVLSGGEGEVRDILQEPATKRHLEATFILLAVN